MKFFLRINFICVIFLQICVIGVSQNKNVGIGTVTPDNSAILHLEANDKGILITRIFLQSANDVTTIPNPAVSLLVYNINTTLGEGFYYWDGTQWKKAIPAPTTVDSLIVNIASFDTLYASFATFDTLFSNYISTDTIFANFASFDSIYASSANFDSLYINGTSIDSFVSNMIDTTAWKLKGNSGTNAASDFIGTIDSTDFIIRTNNNERAKISADGNVNVNSLSGSGTRMVTADAVGLLNTQTIPYGIPQGGIIMWSGTIANIPAGWALCDGTNGTPDLSDKFILSVSSSLEDPGATGGANSFSLSVSQLPAHNHTVSGTTASDGAFTPSGTISTAGNHNHTGTTTTVADHNHTMNHGHGITDPGHRHSMTFYDCGSGSNVPTYDNDDGCTNTQYTNYSSTGVTVNNFSGNTGSTGSHNHTFTTSSDGSHTHSFSGNGEPPHNHSFSVISGDTGTGNSIDNRPAFFKLAFIMKL